MADPLTCIQTAEAITGLITAVIRVVEYCHKLRSATETAQRVLDSIQGLESLLEAVRQICKDETADVLLSRIPQHDGKTAVRHITRLVRACEKSVGRIHNQLQAFETNPGLRGANRLVGALPGIHRELENLTAHKHTLGLWLNVLT